MKFIYLHGFNSAYDQSDPKIFSLSEIGDVIGINYDSYETYENIFDHLKDQIIVNTDTIIVGSSLGGFWAATMAKYFMIPSVIINPCHTPHEMMKKYVGETNLNYVTGDLKTLHIHVPESYRHQELLGFDKSFMYKPLVLLDMGDEIIDATESSVILKGFNVIQFDNGCHRFDHMSHSLIEIRKYIEDLEKT